MKIYTLNTGSNYLAKIVKLSNIRKHPNADRLNLATVDGNTVIVGQDSKEGDLCIYFPLECAIDRNFLSFGNNFSDPTLNADGKSKGFFSDKARVRAVKLRGVPSEGYVCKASLLENCLGVKISEDLVGTEFDSIEYLSQDGDLGSKINTTLLCWKYVPASQREKGPSNTPKKDKTVRHDRIIEGQFRFHVSTEQLKKNVHNIYPQDIISITEKLHGTSLVCSKLLVNSKLKWYEKLLKKIGVQIKDCEYGLVYSSRNVIKNQYDYPKEMNHWYKEDIWGLAAKKLEPNLEDGISIYAEIVGYTPGLRHIQKGYDYGCDPGTFETYVYRMTYTNPSGKVFEFTTNQIKRYCDQKGLKMVPVHYHGPASNYDRNLIFKSKEAWDEEFIKLLTENFLEKSCSMCKSKVPAEGIVVTVEADQFQAYKLKSFAFFEQETKQLDAGEIDIETEESL